MALITRRYKLVGPSNTELARFVGNSAVQQFTYPSVGLDLQVDNAVAGAIDTLDEFMAMDGWVFDATFEPAQEGATRTAVQETLFSAAPISDPAGVSFISAFGGPITTTLDGDYLVHFDAVLTSIQSMMTPSQIGIAVNGLVPAAVDIRSILPTPPGMPLATLSIHSMLEGLTAGDDIYAVFKAPAEAPPLTLLERRMTVIMISQNV